jgi:hypothetical protein
MDTLLLQAGAGCKLQETSEPKSEDAPDNLFDLTGGTNFKTLRDIVLRGLSKQKKGGEVELFEIQINEDTSVSYIGRAVKL